MYRREPWSVTATILPVPSPLLSTPIFTEPAAPFGSALPPPAESSIVPPPSSSGQPSASVSCPADNGTLSVGPDGRLFSVGCDLDLRLTFTGRTVQPSFKSCLDECDAQGPSGGGVSWVPSGQDQTWCWYKTGQEDWTQPTAAVTVFSARAADTTITPDCPSDDGHIYGGADGTHFNIR